jgi:hypothetical protein
MVWSADTNNVPLGAFSVTDQTITNTDTIDYTAKTYTTAVARTYELDNVDPTFGAPFATEEYVTPRGQVYNTNLAFTNTATATASATLPPIPATAIDVLSMQQQSATTLHGLLEWGTSGAFTEDWTAHLTPDFTADPPTLDTGTHTVGWTLTGGALTPSLSAVGIRANRPSASFQSWSWTMYGPGANPPAFPTLPTDFADVNVQATDNFFVFEAGVANVTGGYDAVRANIFNGAIGVVGPTGTTSASIYGTPGFARHGHAGKPTPLARWFAPR